MFGSAISHIHASTICTRTQEPFYSYHWVDDHISVVRAFPGVCEESERSLRLAMAIVFGPSAINETKLTGWHQRLKVLGLEFDSGTRTVSMPYSKITKARQKVHATMNATAITRTEYRSLLGSLRHVATCVRPARTFLQRLRAAEVGHPRSHRVPVTSQVIDALMWWELILQSASLNGVPLQYFTDSQVPDCTVYVDASNYGLAAIDVSRCKYLTYAFTAEEQDLISRFQDGDPNGFDINFRELLNLAFALFAWGSEWSHPRSCIPTHVRFRIDNTSAVAWQSRFSSRNPRARTILRLLALWEVTYNLHFSSQHVAGRSIKLADMGSRITQDPAVANSFRKLTSSWTATQVPINSATFNSIWLSISAKTHLRPHLSQVPTSFRRMDGIVRYDWHRPLLRQRWPANFHRHHYTIYFSSVRTRLTQQLNFGTTARRSTFSECGRCSIRIRPCSDPHATQGHPSS